MKNKLVFGFNGKVRLLYIFILPLLCFSIGGAVFYANRSGWLKMAFCLFITILIIFGLIVVLIKNIKFTKDYIRFGIENGWVRDKDGNTDYANKPAKARRYITKVYYNQIKSVELIKKEDEGLHIINLNNKPVDTLIIIDKTDKNHFIDMTNYTGKQIDFILKELKTRSNIQ